MLVHTYLTKAQDFLKGADLVDQDSEYRYSSALLAIHGAISYSDALRCGLGSTNLAADNHQTASAEMRKLLNIRKYDDPKGLSHLEKIIGNKTFVSYSGDAMSEGQSKAIVEHARRFVSWANQVGSKLELEGWRND